MKYLGMYGEKSKPKRLRRQILGCGLVMLAIFAGGCQQGEEAEVLPIAPATIEEGVRQAVLAQGASYLAGEVATEGHLILETQEEDEAITVYTIASFGYFAFENGFFTKVSGSGAIPTVITLQKGDDGLQAISYQEPEDGSGYADSIKELFPKHLWSQVLTDSGVYPDLLAQQEGQARAYLQDIGRDAPVQGEYVEKELPQINVEASNLLFAEYSKDDQLINSCPYWLGTREELEGDKRFIYETSQSKTPEGEDIIIFAKKDAQGKLLAKEVYVINGETPVRQ